MQAWKDTGTQVPSSGVSRGKSVGGGSPGEAARESSRGLEASEDFSQQRGEGREQECPAGDTQVRGPGVVKAAGGGGERGLWDQVLGVPATEPVWFQ